MVFVIKNHQGEWWSNDIGWVGDRESATEFTKEEREVFNLPIGDNVRWVERWAIMDIGPLRPCHAPKKSESDD